MKKFIIFLILVTLFTPYTLYSQWYKQQIPVNKPITCIKFTDTLNGWAVTGNYYPDTPDTGFILYTSNGGTNWVRQFTRYRVYFSSLAMINNLTGYAGGDSTGNPGPGGPVLLKTTNGGINWFNLPVNINMAFLQLFFLNADTGWENGGLLGPDIRLTTDGGLTWQVRTNGINAITTTLFFLNYNTGFCGAQFNLYKTTNAGMNWNSIGNFSSDFVKSVFFINENTGWLGSTNDKIYFTMNGGINWILHTFPISWGIGTTTDLFFTNNLTGWGGNRGFFKITKTTDGGNNWGYQTDSGTSYKLSFLDSSQGWTGSDLGIYKTTNGGGQITFDGIKRLTENFPIKFELYQNYPNPFNLQTTIQFSIMKLSYAEFKIYDIEGKELYPWIFGWEQDKLLKPGKYELQFDGSDMASGTYFFRLIVTDANSKSLFSKTIKMILLK